MTNVIRGLALICALSLFSSCTTLLLRLKFDGRAVGSKRSDKSLEQYLYKKKINYDYLFRFHEDTLFALIDRPHKPGWPSDFRIMTIHCFNKNDSMILNWTVCEGFLDELKLFENYPPKYNGPFFPTDFTKELGKYLNHGDVIFRNDIPSADLNIVIYWARFLGNMNDESIGKIMDYKGRFPDKKINVILVAIDRDMDWKK